MSALERFGDEHTVPRRTVRAFVDKAVTPHVGAWEAAGQIPRTCRRRLGEPGLLGLELPVEYGASCLWYAPRPV